MKKEKKSSYNNYVPKSAKRCKNLGLIFGTHKKRQNMPTRAKKRSKKEQKGPKIEKEKKNN